MHRSAYALTRPMLWTTVASRYLKLLNQSILPPPNLSHLFKMTDNFGLLQFARLESPNPAFGYTLDDNSRALIVASLLGKPRLSKIYLGFIKACQRSDGSFVNYLSFPGRRPTRQNKSEDLTDAHARALWALSEFFTNKNNSQTQRNLARKIFTKSWNVINETGHLRAKATLIKALLLALPEFPEYQAQMHRQLDAYISDLTQAFAKNSSLDWLWFEPALTYNNAVIPESLFLAARARNDSALLALAVKSLDFLISSTFTPDYYQPVGNKGWYYQGKDKSLYDQQPEDPASMILALNSAYRTTKNETYRNLALVCFSWFLGNNSLQKPICDFTTGGCYDGLTSTGVNLNQGAESLVSYLLGVWVVTNFNENPAN